jgi:hypothetical protein
VLKRSTSQNNPVAHNLFFFFWIYSRRVGCSPQNKTPSRRIILWQLFTKTKENGHTCLRSTAAAGLFLSVCTRVFTSSSSSSSGPKRKRVDIQKKRNFCRVSRIVNQHTTLYCTLFHFKNLGKKGKRKKRALSRVVNNSRNILQRRKKMTRITKKGSRRRRRKTFSLSRMLCVCEEFKRPVIPSSPRSTSLCVL